MKFFLSIFITVVVLIPAAQSQTEKGIYMLGGSTNIVGGFSGLLPNQMSLGFGTNKQEPYKVNYTNFNLSSNGGFFIANGFLLGLNVSAFHGNYKLKDESLNPVETDEFKFTNFNITPFVRYYLNQGNKIQYFAEGRAGIAIQKLDDEESDDSVIVGAKVGAAIFLNKKVALDLFCDFTGGFSEYTEGASTTKVFDSLFGFGLGFDIFL